MTRMDRFCRRLVLTIWCAGFTVVFLTMACLPALIGGGH